MRCLVDAQLPPALARWLVSVIWVRYGNVRRAELLRRLKAAWPEVVEAVVRGESLIELA